MSLDLPNLEYADVEGKRVFVRCDFDVPLSQDLKISDDTRLVSSISTIEYLLEKGATVIAAGHLGRPDKEDEKHSLKKVAEWFCEEMPGTNLMQTHLGELKGFKLKNNFYILENLRFYKGEEENESSFIHKLAYVSDVFVNEAFGSSHRAHASIVGIPRLLPHFAGFHFQKEIRILNQIIDSPRRPFTFIVGGAKIETKLPLISRMHRFADYVLVGGELAEQTKALVKEQHEKISGQKAMLLVADLTPDKFDITLNSVENFEQVIERSETIVWNGPMGKIEEDYSEATTELAKIIGKSSAYKIIGGGDTIAFLNKQGLLDKFDFVSMGGGAMLEFLSGESLPGIVVLQN